LFQERVLCSARPERLSAPASYRVASVVAFLFAGVTLAFAVVAARSLHRPVLGMLVFSLCAVAVGILARRVPSWWLSRTEYLITDKHVIAKNGRLRRSMDRSQISYAVIRWSKDVPGVGDLILERAVPMGALLRTLRIEFTGVRAPDRLLAIIRGADPDTTLPRGSVPLPQRLDEGERVLWTAIPRASSWTRSRALFMLLGVMLLAACARMIIRAVPALAMVLKTHALSAVLSVLLVAAVATAVLLVLGLGASALYTAWIKPARMVRNTRYFVTNRRVLIRRGDEELYLERGRIAYVIAQPKRSSTSLFLVLDGPQARGMSVSGAWGGETTGRLQPVFEAIADADTASELLGSREQSPLRDAA